MWIYEKRLQFPVNIKETNAKLAQDIISQYGGPYAESIGDLSGHQTYLTFSLVCFLSMLSSSCEQAASSSS